MRGIPCEKPPKPILITFDDGSSTVYSEAFPQLSRQGFSAIVFMVTSHMGKPAVWDGETEGSVHRQMTPNELQALSRAGWGVGSHTASHVRLTELEPDVAARQLADSKNELEAVLGQSAGWFAYPYGDFSPALRDAVGKAGYEIAFATERGDGHPLSLARRIISGRDGTLKFFKRLYQARRLSRRVAVL